MTEHIPIEQILKPENVPEDSPPPGPSVIAQPEDRAAAADELVPIKNNKYQSDCCKTDWCIVDGFGISCSGVTYFLILFAEFAVIGVICAPMFPDQPGAYIHTILFTFLVILAMTSHARAMVTDPGAIPKGNFTEENVRKLGLGAGEVVVRCTRCECIKAKRAHHCSTCGRCVRKMDHHCPWINNCVGEANQKYFILFTFYIMLLSMYALGLAVWYVFTCSDPDWGGGSLFDEMKSFMTGGHLGPGGGYGWNGTVDANATGTGIDPSLSSGEKCAYFPASATSIFIIFLIIEGLLFGLFTLIMCITQIMSIVHDETGIEQLKREQRSSERNGNSRARLSEAFGGDFSLHWFSPFTGALTMRNRNRTDYASFDV